MDDIADASLPVTPVELPAALVEGVEVLPFTTVVDRLRADYPMISTARVESILLREWEAFTAGRPLVVPVAVEACVREILDQQGATAT